MNPNKCLSCHGQDPRPIVEPYNVWSGWSGGVGRGQVEYYAPNSFEAAQTQLAYATLLANPDFKFLAWHSDRLPNYLAVEDRRELTESQLQLTTHSAFWHPNALITQAVYQANLLRVARMILNAAQGNSKILSVLQEPRFPSQATTLALEESAEPFSTISMETHFTETEHAFTLAANEAEALGGVNLALSRMGPRESYLKALSPNTAVDGYLNRQNESWNFRRHMQSLGLDSSNLSHSMSQPWNFLSPAGNFFYDLPNLLRSTLMEQKVFLCNSAFSEGAGKVSR